MKITKSMLDAATAVMNLKESLKMYDRVYKTKNKEAVRVNYSFGPPVLINAMKGTVVNAGPGNDVKDHHWVKWDDGRSSQHHVATGALLKEEELEEAVEKKPGVFNSRSAAVAGVIHPDNAKHMKIGKEHDFYSTKNGDKLSGKVHTITKDRIICQAPAEHEEEHGKFHEFKIAKTYDRINESLQEGFRDSVPGHELPKHVKDAVSKVHAVLKKHKVQGAKVSVAHHDYEPKNEKSSAGHHEVNVELGHHHIANEPLVDALNKAQPHKWVYRKGDVTIAPCANIYPSPKHQLHEDVDIVEGKLYATSKDGVRKQVKHDGEAAAWRDTVAKPPKAPKAVKVKPEDTSHKIARHVDAEIGNHWPDSYGDDAVDAHVKKLHPGESRDQRWDRINHAVKKHLGSKNFYDYHEKWGKEMGIKESELTETNWHSLTVKAKSSGGTSISKKISLYAKDENEAKKRAMDHFSGYQDHDITYHGISECTRLDEEVLLEAPELANSLMHHLGKFEEHESLMRFHQAKLKFAKKNGEEELIPHHESKVAHHHTQAAHHAKAVDKAMARTGRKLQEDEEMNEAEIKGVPTAHKSQSRKDADDRGNEDGSKTPPKNSAYKSDYKRESFKNFRGKYVEEGIDFEQFELVEESGHATQDQANKRLDAVNAKHPNAKHSVIQGRRSGKWHVVRHTSGGMHIVESLYTVKHDGVPEDHEHAKLFAGKKGVNNHTTRYQNSADSRAADLKKKGFLNVRVEKSRPGLHEDEEQIDELFGLGKKKEPDYVPSRDSSHDHHMAHLRHATEKLSKNKRQQLHNHLNSDAAKKTFALGKEHQHYNSHMAHAYSLAHGPDNSTSKAFYNHASHVRDAKKLTESNRMANKLRSLIKPKNG